MAITLTEARAFLVALLLEFREDYQAQARIFRVLVAQFPGVDWPTELRARAQANAAFAASGLSVDWWVNEVVRLSA
jgi:hypothetical protein